MAFENVFGNVNYGQIAAAKQANADRFQQAIGQGIAAYELGQERDLKRRQLENKRPAMKNLDYDMIARFQAGDTSPEVMAHLQTRAAMEGEKTTFSADPFGNLRPVPVPNAFASLLGQEPQQQSQEPQQAPQQPLQVRDMNMADIENAVVTAVPPNAVENPASRGNMAAAGVSYDQIPPLNLGGEQVPQTPVISREEFEANKGIQAPSLGKTPRFDASPTGEIKMGEANLSLQEYAAKKNIDLQAADEEMRSKLTQELLQQKLEDKMLSKDSLSALRKMAKDNRKTADMPYAKMLTLPTRLLASDQAQAMDLVNQELLGMALPLVKQLGTNPTDKDMEITLQRVVDLNASKASRQEQIQRRIKAIEEKYPELQSGETPEQTEAAQPIDYTEYFK